MLIDFEPLITIGNSYAGKNVFEVLRPYIDFVIPFPFFIFALSFNR